MILAEQRKLMVIPKIIAIDGPAASGKSTIANLLARSLGYLFFDTGVMYRAVTWAALDRGVEISDEQGVSHIAEQVHIDVRSPTVEDLRVNDVWVDGQDVTWALRTPAVDSNVSAVSAYPGVRRAMAEQQRRIGLRGDIVMVGRDIGTVVLPEAELKIFLDASVEERAMRRYKEQTARGEPASYEAILESVRRRDEFDSNRTLSPLRPAEDAVRVNSDGLTIEEVVERVRQLIYK